MEIGLDKPLQRDRASPISSCHLILWHEEGNGFVGRKKGQSYTSLTFRKAENSYPLVQMREREAQKMRPLLLFVPFNSPPPASASQSSLPTCSSLNDALVLLSYDFPSSPPCGFSHLSPVLVPQFFSCILLEHSLQSVTKKGCVTQKLSIPGRLKMSSSTPS